MPRMTRRATLGALLPTVLGARQAAAQTAPPPRGGTLIYLEQQAYTNLHPPAGGHYPAGGVLNQITDKLTWQNPRTLEIEPWIAEGWTGCWPRGSALRWVRAGTRLSPPR